jgi:type IV pilus assembly protein PilX
VNARPLRGQAPRAGRLSSHAPRSQRGIALITAMVIMLAVLIIGVSAARAALDSEKAARQERDRYVALQAAEAALADAERDIEGGKDVASPRAALFAPDSALGFTDGCGDAPDSANLGLCAQAGGVDAPAWQHAPLDAEGDAANGTIAYGSFTGARLPVGGATMPARLPRYVIELMPYTRVGEDAARGGGGNFYRITAIGFGARAGTSVVLQSFYRKLADQGNPP